MVAPLLILAGIIARVSAECPEGLFQVGNSQQCYRFFHDIRRSWFDAKAVCEAENLTLAEPENPLAVSLYLEKTYGLRYWTWTGLRGDRIPINSNYWRPGRPGNRLTKDHCLVIMASRKGLQNFPLTPYESIYCNGNQQWTLCQSHSTDHARHCGVKLPGNLIIGGQDSDLHEWRWQVALRRRKDDVQMCGGSLISDQWVITAAHCYDNYKESDLYTSLGEHDKYTGSDTPHTRNVGINRVIIHRNYSTVTTGNDIALLELEPYVSNVYIHPVCLPTKHSHSTFAGEKVTVTGWGQTSGGNSSAILQEVDLPVIKNTECSNTYAGFGIKITQNMICNNARGNQACFGDSGGPLVWQTPSGYYILVGIVSFGRGCTDPWYPVANTRVTEYLQWIESNTGERFSEP